MSQGTNPYSAGNVPPSQPVDTGELTVVDWLLCIFCALIGCIVGIVNMVQGKKKGLKMILISIGFAILWNIVSFALQMMVNK